LSCNIVAYYHSTTFFSYELDNNNRHNIREIEISFNSTNGVYITFNGLNGGKFFAKLD